MNNQPQKTSWIIALSLFAIAMVTGTSLFRTNKVTDGLRKVDCGSIKPGNSAVFNVRDYEATIQVPEGEGYTSGTFQIAIPSLGYESGPIDRNGSLETVWIFDINDDTKEDVVALIRSGGSGSYVDIIVLESNGDNYSIAHLPPIPTVQGYMGHDSVSIRNNSIIRSFPTYANKQGIRINRQWQAKDGVKGQIPVKVRSDSNVDPSGSTVEFQFNYLAGKWE